MLKIENLTKKFRKKSVLKELSFDFDHGVYGLLGPNGAGKTTLIRCITQLYPYKEGRISYNDIDAGNRSVFLSHVGYLPQKFGLFRDLTVYEAMETVAALKKLPKSGLKEEIERCVALVNLSDRMKSRVRTLSGGMVKRLGIAQALMGNPDILIFDEPTAGLDPEERLRFKLVISELKQDKTVIISTHIVSDIEAVNSRIAVLNNGKILGFNRCADLAAVAKDKVYIVPLSEISSVKGSYYIQNQYEDGERVMCRIVSPDPQNYEKSAPTLDDGYMCLLKGV